MRSIVILAAGKGERMGDLSIDQPKCLLPIPSLGDNCLGKMLFELVKAGWDHIILVGGHKIEKLREFLISITNLSAEDLQKIILIDATPDYIYGPLYSFLAAETEIPSSSYFWVCPSDTLFAPIIYSTITSISKYLDKINDTKQQPRYDFLISYCDNTEIHDKHCISIDPATGSLMITPISEWRKKNKDLPSELYPLLIPILGLSSDFFSYAREMRNQGATQLYPVLLNYLNSSRKIPYFFHVIPFQNSLFIDFDQPADLTRI